jgi:dTDP-4-amino-4,6-dideoxygalactose transaminase
MLVTDDDALAGKLRLLRSHGMTSLTLDRHKGHAWSYDVVELGYNYRIDEIRSAMGRVQLTKLPRNNQARCEHTKLYHEMLHEMCPTVVVPFQEHAGVSACHLLPILLPEDLQRESFMAQMKAHGIQTSIHYPPVHLFGAYRESSSSNSSDLRVTETLAAREVTLPLYPGLSEKDVKLVVEAVRDSLVIFN